MEDEADEAADQGAVDPDILKVAPDGGLEPCRYRARIPAADRLRHQLDDRGAVARRHADRRAAREAVDRDPDARVALERGAHRLQDLAELAGEHRIGVPGSADDGFAPLLPQAV